MSADLRVVELRPKPPKDGVVADLQELLDWAKEGKLTDFVGVFTVGGVLKSYTTESWFNTIALGQLLSEWGVRKVHEGGR